jgi:hypothetical protein
MAGRVAAFRMAAGIACERTRLLPDEIVRRMGLWIGGERRRRPGSRMFVAIKPEA